MKLPGTRYFVRLTTEQKRELYLATRALRERNLAEDWRHRQELRELEALERKLEKELGAFRSALAEAKR